MHVTMDLMHLVSQISIQMAYYLTLTSSKYIWYDMMSIRSQLRKVGHDLDLKISLEVVFHTEKCMLP